MGVALNTLPGFGVEAEHFGVLLNQEILLDDKKADEIERTIAKPTIPIVIPEARKKPNLIADLRVTQIGCTRTLDVTVRECRELWIKVREILVVPLRYEPRKSTLPRPRPDLPVLGNLWTLGKLSRFHDRDQLEAPIRKPGAPEAVHIGVVSIDADIDNVESHQQPSLCFAIVERLVSAQVPPVCIRTVGTSAPCISALGNRDPSHVIN